MVMAMERAHSADIRRLRKRAAWQGKFAEDTGRQPQDALVMSLAADLLELHDAEVASLDSWESARRLVEMLIGHPIRENGV